MVRKSNKKYWVIGIVTIILVITSIFYFSSNDTVITIKNNIIKTSFSEFKTGSSYPVRETNTPRDSDNALVAVSQGTGCQFIPNPSDPTSPYSEVITTGTYTCNTDECFIAADMYLEKPLGQDIWVCDPCPFARKLAGRCDVQFSSQATCEFDSVSNTNCNTCIKKQSTYYKAKWGLCPTNPSDPNFAYCNGALAYATGSGQKLTELSNNGGDWIKLARNGVVQFNPLNDDGTVVTNNHLRVKKFDCSCNVANPTNPTTSTGYVCENYQNWCEPQTNKCPNGYTFLASGGRYYQGGACRQATNNICIQSSYSAWCYTTGQDVPLVSAITTVIDPFTFYKSCDATQTVNAATCPAFGVIKSCPVGQQCYKSDGSLGLGIGSCQCAPTGCQLGIRYPVSGTNNQYQTCILQTNCPTLEPTPKTCPVNTIYDPNAIASDGKKGNCVCDPSKDICLAGEGLCQSENTIKTCPTTATQYGTDVTGAPITCRFMSPITNRPGLNICDTKGDNQRNDQCISTNNCKEVGATLKDQKYCGTDNKLYTCTLLNTYGDLGYNSGVQKTGCCMFADDPVCEDGYANTINSCDITTNECNKVTLPTYCESNNANGFGCTTDYICINPGQTNSYCVPPTGPYPWCSKADSDVSKKLCAANDLSLEQCNGFQDGFQYQKVKSTLKCCLTNSECDTRIESCDLNTNECKATSGACLDNSWCLTGQTCTNNVCKWPVSPPPWCSANQDLINQRICSDDDKALLECTKQTGFTDKYMFTQVKATTKCCQVDVDCFGGISSGYTCDVVNNECKAISGWCKDNAGCTQPYTCENPATISAKCTAPTVGGDYCSATDAASNLRKCYSDGLRECRLDTSDNTHKYVTIAPTTSCCLQTSDCKDRYSDTVLDEPATENLCVPIKVGEQGGSCQFTPKANYCNSNIAKGKIVACVDNEQVCTSDNRCIYPINTGIYCDEAAALAEDSRCNQNSVENCVDKGNGKYVWELDMTCKPVDEICSKVGV